jgi:hypothetical protein
MKATGLVSVTVILAFLSNACVTQNPAPSSKLSKETRKPKPRVEDFSFGSRVDYGSDLYSLGQRERQGMVDED